MSGHARWAALLRAKGLEGTVVFTACSHAGVINVLKDARNVFGDVSLYAVMGGFDLSGAEVEAIIPETIQDLGEFGLGSSKRFERSRK